jgi:hypothetical protein
VHPSDSDAEPIYVAGGFAVVDRFVHEIYRTGFVQSLILHVALLLVLALIVIRPDRETAALSLALDFKPPTEAVVEMDSFAEVAIDRQPEPEPVRDDPEDSAVASAAMDAALDATPLDVGAVELASFEAAEPQDAFAANQMLVEVPSAVRAMLRSRRRNDVAAETASGDRGIGRCPHGEGGDDIGGELGRRLSAIGAKTGDVQVSIRWDSLDDIDVHVMVEPFGRGLPSVINFTNRLGVCGGMLDVDANANPRFMTRQPVENVFWGSGRAPYGRFTVAVHHYRNWSGQVHTPVEVAVLVDGKVERFHPTVSHGDGPTIVTTFIRRPEH